MAHLSSIQYVMVTKIIISMVVEVRDARGGAEDKNLGVGRGRAGGGGVTVKLRAFSGWGKAVLKISGARAAIFWGWACIPGVGDNGTAKMLVMMCG